MRFKFFSITIFAVLLILLVLPQTASAGLVPCGTIEHPEKCNLCHFFQLLQAIINGASVTLLALAAIFIVIGGIVILSSAGSPDRMSEGKKMITYSIIGIVVCFGAWIIINTVMSALVNPGKMPWPWNKIQCVSAQTNGGGDDDETTGEYCACEVPVYTIDPQKYPDKTQVIGTELKGTELANKDECAQKCVVASVNTYCPQGLLFGSANLYCASQNDLEAKSTHCIELKSKSDDWLRSFSSEQACKDSIDPDKTGFSKECARMCWVNGSSYCVCQNRVPVYQLRRTKKEEGAGTYHNAYDCIRYCGVYAGENCRLGSYQEPTGCRPEEPTNRCDQLNPPLGQTASCFGGNFTCQQGVVDQENEACGELKQLLNCMAGKNLPAAAKEISSIADNSPAIAGSLPGCFQTWTSQCSGSTDSCTGTCCGHSQCSLHYGGKARTSFGPSACGIGSVDCRSCSWAVDFANESYFNQIKTAAENCGKELWDGDLEKVDVIKEGNHVHVELEGIAKYHKCK